MYVEVSHRQSGKTTRLINQIYADKDKYDLQILMGINFDSLRRIKQQIKKNNKVKICCSFKAFKEIAAGTDLSKVRLYIDEFMYSNAFCNNIHQFMSGYTDILKNGYFESSINTNQNSVLWSLSELGNTNIVQVIAFPKGYSPLKI